MLSALILAVTCSGCGASFGYRGYVASDARVFVQSPSHPGQAQGSGVSLVAEPELYAQSEDGKHSLTLRPFARLDPFDESRTHYDLRQADYLFATGDFELGLGVDTLSWGVLRGSKLTDVVSQLDLVEDYDRSEHLGQPYASVGFVWSSVSAHLYYLPFARERTFPGEKGRLRPAPIIATDEPLYESSLRNWHPSFAGRLALTAGDFDIGVTGFSGTSRDPRFVARLTEPGVVPAYDLLQQGGLDIQWTLSELIVRAESVARFHSADYIFSWGVGGGLEYGFFDVAGSGADVVLVAEYFHDHRPYGTPPTLVDDDAFVGFGLLFNDDMDTRVEAGALVDVVTGMTFASFEAGRRLDDHLRLTLSSRSFFGPQGLVESGFLADTYVQARLAYFF